MTSAVIVNLDSQLKKRAMKCAKNDGIPLSSVIRSAIRSYVEGKTRYGMIEEPDFNARTRREILRSLKDIKEGKNLSPAFKTVAEMKKWIDNQ